MHPNGSSIRRIFFYHSANFHSASLPRRMGMASAVPSTEGLGGVLISPPAQRSAPSASRACTRRRRGSSSVPVAAAPAPTSFTAAAPRPSATSGAHQPPPIHAVGRWLAGRKYSIPAIEGGGNSPALSRRRRHHDETFGHSCRRPPSSLTRWSNGGFRLPAASDGTDVSISGRAILRHARPRAEPISL